jgi:hypothetical protein
MSTPSSNSIQDIINAESIRLNEKEQSFNNLQFGKQRVLELNKNFQERTTAFNWIFTVFFSTLAFMILLFYLNTVIYGIDIFVNVAAFAVGVLGLGYTVLLFGDFNKRDPSDFDKIMYQPPGTISADQAASNASANYSSDDVPFRPDSDGSTDGTGNTTTTGNVMIGGDGTGSGMYGNVMIGGNVRGDGTYGNVRGDGTYGNVRGDGIGSNMPMNGPYGDLSSNVYNNYYNNTNYDYDYDYQYNNTYNTYGSGSGSGDGSGIFSKTPIPTDPDKPLGTVTTTSTPSASVNFNIPKLITNEIYLGDTGRDTILVLDQKTFVLFNLHKAKYLFKSLDNVFFTNPTNSKFTATVVTEGPDSKFGVKIFGKGIMITINSTDTYYFYPSNIPATLRENDVFLGSTGQKIEVISKNKFNLLNLTTDPNINSNSKNIQSIYNSIDGYYFIDSENNSNVAKLVIQGPDANTAEFNKIIYGQAILLSNDNTGQKTYYYYNGNTGPKSDDYDDIPDNVFSDTPPLPTPTTTAAPTTAAPTTTTTTTTTTAAPKKMPGLTWKSFLSKNEGYDHSSYSYGNNDYYHRILYHRSKISEDPGNHTFQFDRYYTSGEQPHKNVSSNYAWNNLPSNRNNAIFWDRFIDNRLKIIDFQNSIAIRGNRFGFNQTNNYSNGGRGIGMVITGYFLPSQTGTWAFWLGVPNVGKNDDISVFWIDDKADVRGTKEHWPPSDTNYNARQTWEDSGDKAQYTTNLQANTYYPIQITWGQSMGYSLLGFGFTGPGVGWRTDGEGYFFSDP